MSDDKKSVFLNMVDKDMYLSILRLEQKLKGLQAEIEAKIEALSLESDQTLAKQSHVQLSALSGEVTKVLSNIKAIVNLSVDNDIPIDEYMPQLNREELDQFRELIQENIEKITKLKDAF